MIIIIVCVVLESILVCLSQWIISPLWSKKEFKVTWNEWNELWANPAESAERARRNRQNAKRSLFT